MVGEETKSFWANYAIVNLENEADDYMCQWSIPMFGTKDTNDTISWNWMIIFWYPSLGMIYLSWKRIKCRPHLLLHPPLPIMFGF
jgi:hypothetical protein